MYLHVLSGELFKIYLYMNIEQQFIDDQLLTKFTNVFKM